MVAHVYLKVVAKGRTTPLRGNDERDESRFRAFSQIVVNPRLRGLGGPARPDKAGSVKTSFTQRKGWQLTNSLLVAHSVATIDSVLCNLPHSLKA